MLYAYISSSLKLCNFNSKALIEGSHADFAMLVIVINKYVDKLNILLDIPSKI